MAIPQVFLLKQKRVGVHWRLCAKHGGKTPLAHRGNVKLASDVSIKPDNTLLNAVLTAEMLPHVDLRQHLSRSLFGCIICCQHRVERGVIQSHGLEWPGGDVEGRLHIATTCR